MNDHLVAYPTPMNLNYSWNGGSLAGLMLASQMLTGILLAMHYVGHVDYAFASVQHLMTDVPSGMILRYAHANGASLFFIVVYLHILRGMYYGSGAQPREMVWITGVVILLVMIITAFIGYVLPWGQMSFWGTACAPNEFNMNFNFSVVYTFFLPHIRADKRIGPHSWDFCQTAVGLLLSDAHAERHGNGVRVTLQQEHFNLAFFEDVQLKLHNMGYVLSAKPQLYTRTGPKGVIRYYYRFNTLTFRSLSWLHELLYVEGVKCIKPELEFFLTPASLAYWIGGDGTRVGKGLALCTNGLTYAECLLISEMLQRKLNLVCTVHLADSKTNPVQYRVYVNVESMPLLRSLVMPYLHHSMHYKLSINVNKS